MGVVSRRWLWVESMGVVVRRYIDFRILPIPIYSSCICSFLQQHPTFCSFKKCFSFLLRSCSLLNIFSHNINTHTGDYVRPTADI